MIELKTINQHDPLKRFVEKESGQQELSPMDPPDAYKLPHSDEIPYEDLHPALKAIFDEHVEYTAELKTFEKHLNNIRELGVNMEINKALGHFFSYLDEHISKHSHDEDKWLFIPLHKQLLEHGEHSKGPEPFTAVDMLEAEHLKATQLAAVSFNLFGLVSRLTDQKSQAIVLDAAIEQSLALVELLRLHFFREEKIMFPLAQKYLTEEDWDQISRAWKVPVNSEKF